jgi:HK97 family phage major capsid protein
VAYNNITSRTDAGALMPEEVSNDLLKNLSSTSTGPRAVHPGAGRPRQVRFPVLSALPVAYWVTGDTGLKQTTEVNWANKYLNIEELAVIVPIPDNVIADSGQPIWSQVQPLCEQAAGRLIDTAVFFGTNAPASFPTNVVAAAVAAGNTATRGTNAAAGGIIGDWSDLLGTLEADGYDANSAVGIRTLRGLFRQARSTQGERLEEISITPDYVEIDGTRITFPMRGLWPAAAANSAEAIVFDRSEFVLGVRQDITWKLLDQAVIQDNTGAIVYNLAQQDMVAMRMTMRVGWQVANTINYDQPTEASRYPAAVLRHS